MTKKVNLKEPIDTKNLRMEKHEKSLIHDVYLPLDSIPDATWERCFEREKHIAVWNLEARLSISYDNLVVTIPIDEINQKMLATIKKVIDATNQCVEEQNKANLEKDKIRLARKKREEEEIQKARNALKS